MTTPGVVHGNPIITHTYTSDPAVLVHDGVLHLYTGHDEAPPGAGRFVRDAGLVVLLLDRPARLAGPRIPARSGRLRVGRLRRQGAHVHRHDGWFHLASGYDVPQRVAHARSRGLDGPWEFQGS